MIHDTNYMTDNMINRSMTYNGHDTRDMVTFHGQEDI